MKAKLRSILLIVVIAFAFTSCQETPEYVSDPFSCECGEMLWNGANSALQGAEYVFVTDNNSRRYYTTADVSVEGEHESHNLNYTLQIDDVNTLWWDIEYTPLAMEIEEANNNIAVKLKYFAPISGIVEVNPAIFGTVTSEKVTFDLIIRQVVGGSLVGPEIPFNGSFDLDIEYEQ